MSKDIAEQDRLRAETDLLEAQAREKNSEADIADAKLARKANSIWSVQGMASMLTMFGKNVMVHAIWAFALCFCAEMIVVQGWHGDTKEEIELKQYELQLDMFKAQMRLEEMRKYKIAQQAEAILAEMQASND